LRIDDESAVNQAAIFNLYPLEMLCFRRLWFFGPAAQMAVVAMLYTTTTLLFIRTFRLTGKMLGGEPDVWILFVPITEEILFRGFILGALEIAYGRAWAVIVSSALFGLWHLKNSFWMTDADLSQEIIYTAFIFGPVTAILALKTRSVWLGVMLHYLNNLPSTGAASL
jgi:membrane protease YdiL (CAAX protease family)